MNRWELTKRKETPPRLVAKRNVRSWDTERGCWQYYRNGVPSSKRAALEDI